MAQDPVCGMNVDEQETSDEMKIDYKGETYNFCSFHCKAKFENEPSVYAEK